MNRAQLTEAENIRDYLRGGHGAFTIVNGRTGSHFTYKLGMPEVADPSEDRAPRFVRVLTGPDNTADYQYIGQFRVGYVERDGYMQSQLVWQHGRKSRISEDSQSVMALNWFLHRLNQGKLDDVQFFHEGKCGRCGRKLTTPESIASGIGPVCAGRTLGDS